MKKLIYKFRDLRVLNAKTKAIDKVDIKGIMALRNSENNNFIQQNKAKSVQKKKKDNKEPTSQWEYTLNRTQDNIPEYLFKKFESMAHKKNTE